MRLLIREKIFSWSDQFTVMDENGGVRYTVEGQLFSWGKKLRVYDLAGQEVAYIEQKVMSFMPRYRVYVGEVLICEVIREFSFFRPKYSVLGAGWHVDGEFWEHDYTVTKDNRTIVSINKEWFAWGDCYTLDFADPANELYGLALVLAIDCAMEANG